MSDQTTSILVIIGIALLIAWLRSMLWEPYYGDDDVYEPPPVYRGAVRR